MSDVPCYRLPRRREVFNIFLEVIKDKAQKSSAEQKHTDDICNDLAKMIESKFFQFARQHGVLDFDSKEKFNVFEEFLEIEESDMYDECARQFKQQIASMPNMPLLDDCMTFLQKKSKEYKRKSQEKDLSSQKDDEHQTSVGIVQKTSSQTEAYKIPSQKTISSDQITFSHKPLPQKEVQKYPSYENTKKQEYLTHQSEYYIQASKKQEILPDHVRRAVSDPAPQNNLIEETPNTQQVDAYQSHKYDLRPRPSVMSNKGKEQPLTQLLAGTTRTTGKNVIPASQRSQTANKTPVQAKPQNNTIGRPNSAYKSTISKPSGSIPTNKVPIKVDRYETKPSNPVPVDLKQIKQLYIKPVGKKVGSTNQSFKVTPSRDGSTPKIQQTNTTPGKADQKSKSESEDPYQLENQDVQQPAKKKSIDYQLVIHYLLEAKKGLSTAERMVNDAELQDKDFKEEKVDINTPINKIQSYLDKLEKQGYQIQQIENEKSTIQRQNSSTSPSKKLHVPVLKNSISNNGKGVPGYQLRTRQNGLKNNF